MRVAMIRNDEKDSIIAKCIKGNWANTSAESWANAGAESTRTLN